MSIIRFVTAPDLEYALLCDLRYRVFFAPHQLPFEILFDAQEAISFHAIYSQLPSQAVKSIADFGDEFLFERRAGRASQIKIHPSIKQGPASLPQPVLACGRLTPNLNGIYQISQMAVEPLYQRQGLGQAILRALIDRASLEQAEMLTLNARLSAVSFYQKFGFVTVGQPFASAKTSIPHVEMQLQL
jgi:GNAT superfamily N-acetyltransferase